MTDGADQYLCNNGDEYALTVIMTGWTRSDRTAAKWIAALASGVGDGGYMLDTPTVVGEYADNLTGGQGIDFFLSAAGEDNVTARLAPCRYNSGTGHFSLGTILRASVRHT